MVKIKGFKEMTRKDGTPFYVLIVQDEPRIAISSTTGKAYFTAPEATVATTLEEAECKKMIGSDLDGRLEKVACEPYQWVNQDTGEVKKLNYRWEYVDPMHKAKHDDLGHLKVA